MGCGMGPLDRHTAGEIALQRQYRQIHLQITHRLEVLFQIPVLGVGTVIFRHRPTLSIPAGISAGAGLAFGGTAHSLLHFTQRGLVQFQLGALFRAHLGAQAIEIVQRRIQHRQAPPLARITDAVARPEQALAATGFERGTIVPLGSTTAWPVIADQTISGRVALGAGRPGHSLLTDAEPLLHALDATVADISDPE